MTISANLKGVKLQNSETATVWEGPEGTGPQGGVSQSLIGRWLANRKTFELYALRGLQPYEQFSAPLEFGNMFHLCEEQYGKSRAKSKGSKGVASAKSWQQALEEYTRELIKKYQMDADKIAHWYQMCLALFPEYVEYWAREKSEKERSVLFNEHTFDVPYTLPSKRVVRLRGKRDGGSIFTKGGLRHDGLWLDENKTKSSIDQTKICRQLKFDLQTMTYLVAMYADKNLPVSEAFWTTTETKYQGDEIRGVRYNVIRRSAHKSTDSMLKKLHEDVADNRGGEWFGRWTVPITAKEVLVFRETCLDPVLEWMCVWYDTVALKKLVALGPYDLQRMVNYRHPYGVWNPMDEGGTNEYDFHLENGSMAGLHRVTELFPELV